MRSMSSTEIRQYAHETLTLACTQRLKAILASDIDDLLPGDPYAPPSASPTWAGRVVEDVLEHRLREAESDSVDALLCALAAFVAERGCDGRRSGLPGVDLEFSADGVHYLISVSPRTGGKNDAAQRLKANALRHTMTRLNHAVQPVMGYCYGGAKTDYVSGCLRVVGPSFWHLISRNQRLYTDIVEIVNHWVKACRDTVADEEARAINRLTKQFIDRFCTPDGAIDWVKLVEFNSGNYDLDKFLPPA